MHFHFGHILSNRENIPLHVNKTPSISSVPSCFIEISRKKTRNSEVYQVDAENIDTTNQDVAQRYFTPVDVISSFPEVLPKKTIRKRETQLSEILTSTPIKGALRN